MTTNLVKRPLFDTHRFRSAAEICNFLESGERSVFYDHTKLAPPGRMTGNDEIDRKNRDAGIPRKSLEQPSHLAVGVGVCVYDVSDIDIDAGTFFGNYRLMLKWRVPELQKILDGLGIKRDADRTSIPISTEEWRAVTSRDVSEYKEFAKAISIPSFAMNSLGGDPTITQRYAYVAESTDFPDIITLQTVFHGKFKVMESSARLWYFPFEPVSVDFKIRLWDNKRDGARFFQPLRFPDGTHFLYPLKMNVTLPDFDLFVPQFRLYRQGGMKGENASGPSVFSMSLVAKPKPHKFVSKVVAVNAVLGSAMLLVGSVGTSSLTTTAQYGACLGLGLLKLVHTYISLSPRMDKVIMDSYSLTSLAISGIYTCGVLGLHPSFAMAELLLCGSLSLDILAFLGTKVLEVVQVRSPNRLPQSTWKQEMGPDFDSRRVHFE